MMDNNNLEEGSYILAEGPEGLRSVLDDLLSKAQKDPDFAAQGHYILYQLGGQKSLIKVDMTSKPFKFWYNDLLGRPATNTVKKTIALFLMEKCGEKEENLQELLG